LKYCTQCGAPIEEGKGKICESCLAGREQVAALDLAEGGAESGAGESVVLTARSVRSVQEYMRLFGDCFRHPDRNIREFVSQQQPVPAAVAAVVAALIMSAVSLVYIRRAMAMVERLIGGLLGDVSELFMGDSFGGFGFEKIIKIPYFETFIRLFFVFLGQWVLLSLLLFGMAKLFKSDMKPVHAFNAVGISKLYLATGSFLLLILGVLHLFLGIAGLVWGVVASYLAVYWGTRPYFAASGRSVYALSCAAALYVFAELVLIRLLM